MYIVLAYDVGADRTQCFKKMCQRYLGRVQNSVFEGELSDAQLRTLSDELELMVKREEMVRIWEVRDGKDVKILTIGEPKCIEGNII